MKKQESRIKVLLADDEKNLRAVLSNELTEEGFLVKETDNGLAALDMLAKDELDVLLLDINMPGKGGMEVLKELKSLHISTEVIILTGHGTVSSAVEAIKHGAYDFLTKPFNLEELKAIIHKAYEKKLLLKENLSLREQIRRQEDAETLVTKSPAMKDILEDTVTKVAASDMPVLILGESGVGKELVARAVHRASLAPNGPFVPINCGAIPESMIESELFGHERGAFTGAYEKKPGLLDLANGGTLFLDEIGELPMPLQVKLLRVIETGSFFRVGGTKEIRVKVKFISATNKDLRQETTAGNFRQDLYFRISALTILIPPLRERREDIPLLIEHFKTMSPAFRKKNFSDAAVSLLCDYEWPGNVRELQNVIHRSLLLASGDMIDAGDLPSDLRYARTGSGRKLSDVEKDHILKVLGEVSGHQGRAAEILGIDPKTLYRKLRDYGIKR